MKTTTKTTKRNPFLPTRVKRKSNAIRKRIEKDYKVDVVEIKWRFSYEDILVKFNDPTQKIDEYELLYLVDNITWSVLYKDETILNLDDIDTDILLDIGINKSISSMSFMLTNLFIVSGLFDGKEKRFINRLAKSIKTTKEQELLKFSSYKNISSELANVHFETLKDPSEVIDEYEMEFADITKEYLISFLTDEAFKIYIKRLKDDTLDHSNYLTYFIPIKETDNEKQTKKMDELLIASKESEHFQGKLVEYFQLYNIPGTRSITHFFPNLSSEGISVFNKILKNIQFRYFEEVAKNIFEHDTTASDKLRRHLQSRTYFWKNYTDSIDEIKIFLPSKSLHMIQDYRSKDRLPDSILNIEIGNTSIDTEIVFIFLKDLLIIEKFRGSDNDAEVYKNVPDSLFNKLSDWKFLGSNEISQINLIPYARFKINHKRYLWQIETAKLLNEIFNIKIDDLNKFLVAVYNDHNNWDSLLTPIPSYRDQLKKLRDEKL